MHRIIIQIACDNTHVPKPAQLRKWAKSILKETMSNDPCEVTLRIVGTEEMTALNETYRQKKGPTNVLSFPFELADTAILDVPILGDIIICADVVRDEAQAQGKSYDAHFAHMVIHGILHLQGYDHVIDSDAIIMESLEIVTLQHLGFANPYDHGENTKHHD